MKIPTAATEKPVVFTIYHSVVASSSSLPAAIQYTLYNFPFDYSPPIPWIMMMMTMTQKPLHKTSSFINTQLKRHSGVLQDHRAVIRYSRCRAAPQNLCPFIISWIYHARSLMIIIIDVCMCKCVYVCSYITL